MSSEFSKGVKFPFERLVDHIHRWLLVAIFFQRMVILAFGYWVSHGIAPFGEIDFI
jgi:hypothetical protein